MKKSILFSSVLILFFCSGVSFAQYGSAYSTVPPVSGGGISTCSGGGAVSNQFLSALSSNCAATLTQPNFTNLAGTIAAGQQPALAGDVIGAPGANTATKINGNAPTTAAVSNQFCSAVDSSGRCTLTQPAFPNLSGVATTAQLPALLNTVNSQGTIGSGGTLSSDLSLGNIVAATVGGGAYTIAKPTNGVAGVIYYLQTTSTADVAGTYATGWLQVGPLGTLILPGTHQSGPVNTVEMTPFYYDGTNYQLVSFSNLYARRLASLTISGTLSNTNQNISTNTGTISTTSGAHTSTTGAMGPTAGGVLQSYGGTAPTITAACGSSPSAVVGSNTAFTFTTGSGGIATSCTISFSASGVFHAAPICIFTDASASVTPVAFATGATSTSTVVVDFVAATGASKAVNGICIGQ